MLTDEEVLEVDRVARAYGYEIGRGHPLTETVKASEDNPFLDPNWRVNMVAEMAPDEAPVVPFFPALAANLVYDHVKALLEPTDQAPFTPGDVYLVTFSFVLGNWKALVSTTLPDGMYYEVTHNSVKDETYITSYKQWAHKTVPVQR